MSGSTILVTLTALVARLILWGLRPGLTYDGTYYLRQAERLFHGEFQIIGFPPGYPLVVLLLRTVVGDFELAGRLTSLLGSVATVAVFHVWARRQLPATLALTGAFILALHPEMVRSGVEILSEPLYLFCIVSGFFLFETRRDVAAGAFLGYAFLVRPEAIALILGCVAWRLVRFMGTAEVLPANSAVARFPLRFLVVALVPVILFSALASHAVGHWVLSPKQGQLDLGAALDARIEQTLRSLHALFPILLLPAVAYHGWRRRLLPLAGIAYIGIIPLFAVHIQPRLLQPALPFLLLVGLAWIASLRLRLRIVALVLSAGFMIWGAVPVFRSLLRANIVTPYDRRLGESLRPSLHFEDRVACRFPIVPYYAGAGFARVPLASYLTTMDSLVTLGATHLLLLEHEVLGMIPQLRPLFDDANFAAAEGRLEMVQALAPTVGPRALLYRFKTPLISPSRSIVVQDSVVSATWSGSTLFFTSLDGHLHQVTPDGRDITPPFLAGLTGLREIRASDDGRRLACTQEDAEGLVVADLDVSTGRLRRHAVTRGSLPGSPCWVGEWILYVVHAGSGGLQVLEPNGERLRPVTFSGVDPSEATPLYVTSRGREIATTYVRPQRQMPDMRVLATASWPDVAVADEGVVLQGRWATQVPLTDDAIAWVPGADRLVGSAAVRELDDEDRVVHGFASLAVYQAGGGMRTFSFGIASPAQPALTADHMAFISEGSVLRIVEIAADELHVPTVHVFDTVREPLRSVPH